MWNNKSIIKAQRRFKSERQNVVIEEINKVALNQRMIKEWNQLVRYKHMHMAQASF